MKACRSGKKSRRPKTAKGRSVTGRARVLGDNINTDLILAGKYCRMADPAELGRHAFEGVIAGFAGKVRKGDIIVAGRNFGCGSSREQAPLALLAAGVSAIVASSFGRIFFRNAINLGLTVMKCPGARASVRPYDRVSVDAGRGTFHNGRDGRMAAGERLPEFLLDILDAGGLVPYMGKRLRRRREGRDG